ncbi:porin [Palleronia sp. LCG004]|uniref:porin n=1 Tax=Palleronia sp. LCG004 TaxID=3079304 RepID=UPI002942D26E|nr:porin [Palleronia sp. LCG004]WOI55536.1 porin [Palleronia sp. LCG004]
MKNILMATTALVASTTFAMADVDLSGWAEMGIIGGEETDGSDRDTQFHSDIDVRFSMSGTTDNGLTFGAFVDLDSTQGDGGAFVTTDGGSDTAIFVSSAFGTLTMGDTDGALDFVMQEAIIGGTIDDVHEHAGYNGNSGLDGTYDGQVARYDYSFGDFSVAVSAEIDDDRDSDSDADFDFGDSLDEIEDDNVLAVGVRYAGTFAGNDFGAGLGYQQAGDTNVTGLSLDTILGFGLQVIFNYSTYDNAPLVVGTVQQDPTSPIQNEFVGQPNNAMLDNHYGLALGYDIAGFKVAANYGIFETDQGDVQGLGLIANYDLGGGANLQGGWARSEYDNIGGFEDTDNFSLGIRMNF